MLSERKQAIFDAYLFIRDQRNHESNCDFEEIGVCTCDGRVIVEAFKGKFREELKDCLTVEGDGYKPYESQ